jgi:hypothetical protein
MVVRISRAKFDPPKFDRINEMLIRSQDNLIPSIRKLPGLVSYYAGIDHTSGTMVQVSVWKSEEAAEAMTGLREMAAAAVPFLAEGVEFEQPIINYRTVWQI